MVVGPVLLYAGPMAEPLLSTIARAGVQAAGAQVVLETTVLPPLAFDVSGALTAPAATGPNPFAAAAAWLIRPTIRAELAGRSVRRPLTEFGAAPQGGLAQLVLPVATAVGLGLTAYGAWTLGKKLLGYR